MTAVKRPQDMARRRCSVVVVAWLVTLPWSVAHAQRADVPPRARKLIDAAVSQVGVTTQYDGTYRRIGYPGGDVPVQVGVCTDVLIRAYRRALGIDLQQLVHEDMRRAWTQYPKLWNLSRPDANVDHRRVPNLETFFRRHGAALTPTRDARRFLPGDIVSWRLPGGHPHIGLVIDRRDGDQPLVVHNIGAGVKVEDMLFSYPIVGHFRF